METCTAHGVSASSEWFWNSTLLGLSPVQTHALSKKVQPCFAPCQLSQFWRVLAPLRPIYGCWDFEILHLYAAKRSCTFKSQPAINMNQCVFLHSFDVECAQMLVWLFCFSWTCLHSTEPLEVQLAAGQMEDNHKNSWIAEAYSESTAVAVEATAGELKQILFLVIRYGI